MDENPPADARAMRRAMLGDAYVDAQAADPDPVMQEFQEYITSMAWGVWARGLARSAPGTAACWSWP
jgi:4-carboxymuconolactone decarboxylase